MYGYIYKTTNLLDNKIYIGQHKCKVFDYNYYGSGTWFKNILKKYGKKNFKCEMIEACESLEILNEREIYWIEYFQSRNSSIGYNLAKGGEQINVECTENEIEYISKKISGMVSDDIEKQIYELQGYGLRVYEKNEEWKPTSNNSTKTKMIAKEDSIIISFYTRKQQSMTKKYAIKFNCLHWKYNLMVEINKIPQVFNQLYIDYMAKNIISESFKGPGVGTTGIFLETKKHTKSSRMPFKFK